LAYEINFGVQDLFLAREIRNLVRSNSVSQFEDFVGSARFGFVLTFNGCQTIDKELGNRRAAAGPFAAATMPVQWAWLRPLRQAKQRPQ
jgi:hypothetical protein